MSPIPVNVIPPPPGLEKEEPEFAHEDDLPLDDDSSADSTSSTGLESSGEIERE